MIDGFRPLYPVGDRDIEWGTGFSPETQKLIRQCRKHAFPDRDFGPGGPVPYVPDKEA